MTTSQIPGERASLRPGAVGISHLFVLIAVVALLAIACSGGTSPSQIDGELDVPPVEPVDPYHVGRPLERPAIGDVERAFGRFERTRSELIAFYQSQPWYQDGLTRDEALFVERSLTFNATLGGPRNPEVSRQTIEQKLYLYEVVPMATADVELMLIYEPGQDGARQMYIMLQLLPALEAQVGVPYPEKVMVVVNGRFGINDFNEGEFIRVDRCCVLNPFILAHELAHTYWHIGPPWFDEGMADIYAVLTLEQVDRDPPANWGGVNLHLDAFIEPRRRQAERFDQTLPNRLARQALYEAADAFLYDVRETVGADSFRSAARHMYLASDFGRYNLGTLRIQDLFLEYAPESVRGDVSALFNRWIWGDDGERYRQLKELEQD